jgi:hypothetical protein
LLTEETKLEFIQAATWPEKAASFLLISKAATASFPKDSETQIECRRAIGLCWHWLAHEAVDPKDLSFFIDSDLTINGSLDERKFIDGSREQDSLILILLVVAFLANKAYRVAGLKHQMSEPVSEAGEESVGYIFGYIKRLGFESLLETMLNQ